MRQIEVRELIAELNLELPPADEFWQLGDQTGQRWDEQNGFYRSNYERGPLLFALVAQRRPRRILEFGTGRGYDCLCMARALVEHDIDGEIVTIDRVPSDRSTFWPIDWHDGAGPHTEKLSRDQVWSRVAPASWLARIRCLTGTAAQVMASGQVAGVELAFIDGDHGYEGVRHDFHSLLDAATDDVAVVFDDYDGDETFGVARLVCDEVARGFDCQVVTNAGAWCSGDLPNATHAMVWSRRDADAAPLREVYPPELRRRAVRGYRLLDAPKRWLRALRANRPGTGGPRV